MKRILFLILVLFVAGACLDDKTNTDYRDITLMINGKLQGLSKCIVCFLGSL